VTIDPATLGRAQKGDPAAVEQVLDAIAADARTQRRRTASWVWVTSLVVATICLVGFVVFVTTEPTASRGGSLQDVSGGNFSVGVVIGLVAGVAIGWTMARAKR
jgi:hypothetical protein